MNFRVCAALFCHTVLEYLCACSLSRPHISGCFSPSPHLKDVGMGNSGTCLRLRLALGSTQNKRHIWQIYWPRSVRLATRQAAPSHIFNLSTQSSLHIHFSAKGSYATRSVNVFICWGFVCPTHYMYCGWLCTGFRTSNSLLLDFDCKVSAKPDGH